MEFQNKGIMRKNKARNKLVGIVNWLVRKAGSYKTYGQTFEKIEKKNDENPEYW
jgi:hypothetical protein